MTSKWHLKCQLKPLKNMFYHEIIELRCCREWSGYARGNTAIFLVRPYLSNPRDLDFFKRNICICCSPPFYFPLFALGATSLPEQVTCRIFHFLLLDQEPNPWAAQLNGDQVCHVKLNCGKIKACEPFNRMLTKLHRSLKRRVGMLYTLVCEAERERQGNEEEALIIARRLALRLIWMSWRLMRRWFNGWKLWSWRNVDNAAA